MLSTPEVEQKVRQALLAVPVPAGSRILAAFSGGPDSTALLAALESLRPQLAFALTAAYLDHGLRPAAEVEAEIEHVRSVAGCLRIETAIGRVPPGRIREAARLAARSLEAAAREERYAFLQREAAARGCAFIALGHTEDDHLETILMRFFQGAGPAGLAGIPRRRDRIIRPLLDCSRAEVLRYLEERRLPVHTDPTNLQEGFLRNAVRARLLPQVRGLFPGWRGSLSALAERIRLYQAFVEEEAAARLAWAPQGDARRIEERRFLQAPGLLRVTSFYRVADLLTGGRAIPFRFLSPLLDDGFVRRRRVLLRGYGIRLSRKGGFLVAQRDIVGDGKKGYLVVIESGQASAVGEARIRFPRLPASTVEEGAGHSLSRVIPPLVLRSRKPGDRIRFQRGSKTIKKLFGEWQVPPEERWKIPLLADRAGVVGVLGRPWGYTDCFRGGIDADLFTYVTQFDEVEEK